MARSRLVVLLAGPLLLAGAAVAAAQAPPPTLTPAPPAITPGPGITTPAPGVPTATVTTPAGDVTVLADHLEQVGADNLLVATGNVEITRATTRITADRAEINRNTGDLVAVGRVVLYDVDDRITGERIDYNLNSGTGVVYNGAADVPPYYHIGGERMERRGEGRYHIRKGFLTTCEDDPPTWGFHFGSLDADLETSLFGTNGSLWVKKLPVLPFVPFFAAALRRERQTGFLFPLFGSTTRKGYFYEQPFYWAISDSQDATFTLDYYQLRGIGANVEYRYLLDAQNKGTLNGFFIKENLLPAPETDHGENRGWFGFRHESLLGPGLTFKADINAVSDDVLLRDYGDQLYQRSSQDVQSNVFVTKSWSQWSMTAAVFEYQDLTSPRAVELYRLPDVRFSGSAHPVEAWNGFTYTLDSRLTNFVRDVGSSGGRLDIAQRISQPFSPGGYFTVTPFLATQMTAYSTGVTGTRPVYREGLTIEETDGTPRLRPIYSVGGDVTARASRVYQTDGFWNLDAVLHSIEPQVNYTMLDGTHFDKLPQPQPVVRRAGGPQGARPALDRQAVAVGQ